MRVPKWFLDLRSSLKRQRRRSFFLQLLPSDFFYRLNDKADLSGVPPDQCQAACSLGLSIEYRIFPNKSKSQMISFSARRAYCWAFLVGHLHREKCEK